MKFKLRNALFGLLATVCLPLSAVAMPISGQLDFGGVATVTRNATDQIESLSNVMATAQIATGAFSGISFGDAVTFTDPLVLVPDPTPVQVWSVGGFSFTLNTVLENTATFVSGVGIVSAAGFTDTVGAWSLTSQCGNGTSSCPTTSANFSFSSSTVPEPTFVSLLGLMLLGMGVVAIRRRNGFAA